jgi:hypothetical protein
MPSDGALAALLVLPKEREKPASLALALPLTADYESQ